MIDTVFRKRSRLTLCTADKMEFEPEMIQPRVDFCGLIVSAGKVAHIAPHLQEEEGLSVSVHITQVALGANAQPGPHTVFAVRDKQPFAIGTLEKGRCEHFAVDYMCTTDVSFRHTGQTDISVTGYRHISPVMDTLDGPGMLPDGQDTSSEDVSDDEEEAPALVQHRKLQPKQVAGQGIVLQNGRRAKLPAGLKENTFEDDREDSDEDLEPLDDDLRAASDDEEDSGDDEDEDAEEKAVIATDALLKPVPAKMKRSAAATVATPAKKAKTVAAAEPAAAPSTGSAGYTKSIKDYIGTNGPTRLSDIGSKVMKPAGLNVKLKKFLDDSGLFLVDTKQMVTLK